MSKSILELYAEDTKEIEQDIKDLELENDEYLKVAQKYIGYIEDNRKEINDLKIGI